MASRNLSLVAVLLAAGGVLGGCGDDDGASGTGAMDAGGMGGAGTGGAGTGGTGGDTDSGAGTGGSGCDESQVTDVNANITADTTWDCGTYVLKNIIYVTDNATLSIAPGVEVQGDVDVSGVTTALIVTRGSKLMAEGTAQDPIVFTSSADVGERLPGDWGGVVLLGRARINTGNCVDGTGDACTGGYFENAIEGLDPTLPTSLYGGTDDEHDCGTIRYARIEFAGYELAPMKELNGLSVGACGSDTEISYLQVHRGSDDGIEFFGGTVGMNHVVISGASDDSLDWDLGWTGKAQFVVVHQKAGDGDKGFEADNNGDVEAASPRSNPTLYNFTMVGNPTKTALLLREGTLGTLRNFLIQDFSIGLDLAAAQVDLNTEWPANISIEHSCFYNNTRAGDADPADPSANPPIPENGDEAGGAVDEDALLRDAARNNVFDVDPMLGNTSITGPNYVPTSTMLGGKATPPAGMDVAATYCGAFAQGGTDWTSGWTSYLPE